MHSWTWKKVRARPGAGTSESREKLPWWCSSSGFGREMMLASVAQGLGFQSSQGQEAKPWAHRKRVMELHGISTLPINWAWSFGVLLDSYHTSNLSATPISSSKYNHSPTTSHHLYCSQYSFSATNTGTTFFALYFLLKLKIFIWDHF